MELMAPFFFIQALQESVASRIRWTAGPHLQGPIWVISPGKGSKRNSSPESNQLFSRWMLHVAWASVAGLGQLRESLLNLIYVNIRYYLRKSLQQQAAGYWNISLQDLAPVMNLRIHFNTSQQEQPGPFSRRHFSRQSTSYPCYQQARVLLNAWKTVWQ